MSGGDAVRVPVEEAVRVTKGALVSVVEMPKGSVVAARDLLTDRGVAPPTNAVRFLNGVGQFRFGSREAAARAAGALVIAGFGFEMRFELT